MLSAKWHRCRWNVKNQSAALSWRNPACGSQSSLAQGGLVEGACVPEPGSDVPGSLCSSVADQNREHRRKRLGSHIVRCSQHAAQFSTAWFLVFAWLRSVIQHSLLLSTLLWNSAPSAHAFQAFLPGLDFKLGFQWFCGSFGWMSRIFRNASSPLRMLGSLPARLRGERLEGSLRPVLR